MAENLEEIVLRLSNFARAAFGLDWFRSSKFCFCGPVPFSALELDNLFVEIAKCFWS